MIFPNGSSEVILYSASSRQESFLFSKIKTKFNKSFGRRFFGVLSLLISFFGLFLIFGPMLFQEFGFRLGQLKEETIRKILGKPKVEKKIKFADLLGKVEATPVPVPVDITFGIVIPKIGVNAKVIPNVPPDNPKEFTKALKVGVAHAAGSAFPNQEGVIFIFGHSTDFTWNVARYNALFYQIKDLEIGDEINLFYGGQRYLYKVKEKRIVAASDTSFLGNPSGKLLILQTCWPPGTTKERLLIFAKPIGKLSYNLTNNYFVL